MTLEWTDFALLTCHGPSTPEVPLGKFWLLTPGFLLLTRTEFS